MSEGTQPTGGTGAGVYVPDGTPWPTAEARVTHLGVMAHPDDLELLALPWIAECRGRTDRGFGGLVCADGAGSARGGAFAGLEDAGLVARRAEEQRRAADVGAYAWLAHLGWPSSDVRDRDRLAGALAVALDGLDPEVVITHDPCDRHATHRAVTQALLIALRLRPRHRRPARLLAVEGWRSLAWLPPEERLAVDCSAAADLGRELAACFASQIEGGKRYDLAMEGRRRANATLADPYEVDAATQVVLALDLTPLLHDDTVTLADHTAGLVRRFADEVRAGLPGTDRWERL